MRRFFMRSLFIYTACLAALPAWSASVRAVDGAEIDAMVSAAVARYRLPGIAVGIVKDGEVVYRKSMGSLQAGKHGEVNADSIFKIASNSKAMTTAVLARLVDRGLLDWDDPVRKYLPEFRMSDAWVSENMQVRDLLIHNTGLASGAGDLLLWPTPNLYTRQDVLAALPAFKPVYSFRSQYSYDNLLYIVAGEVAAKAAHSDYESLVQNEVFGPLGLKRCRVGRWNRVNDGNVAQPHQWLDGRNAVVRADSEWIEPSADTAAGGIRCSLNDMLVWAQTWLKPDDSWLSAARREELWQGHMPMPLGKRQMQWDNAHFNAYGYGWRRSDVDGQLKIAHTGTLAGMYSVLSLLPESGIGIVILINGEASEARTVLNQSLLKYFTEPARKNPFEYYAASLAAETPAEMNAAPMATPFKPVSAESLKSHWGIYRDAWFGEMALCPSRSTLQMQALKSPRIKAAVRQLNGRYALIWDDPSVDGVVELVLPAYPGNGLRIKPWRDGEGDGFNWQDLDLRRVRACPGKPLAQADSGMVDVQSLAPMLHLDMRYATANNFTGKKVAGYHAAKCLLHKPAAEALSLVERDLNQSGHALTIFDCYRPTIAVDDFMRWAKNADASTKAEYYPALDKSALVPDYIAEKSGHSKGATLDLGLMDCRAGKCVVLDMGTAFDFFGAQANTAYPGLSVEQRRNRQLLIDAMKAQGFENYPMEWWHFSWKAAVLPDQAFSFPIQ